MKSRILPFSLKALTLGTASLLLATASMAHQEKKVSDKFILEQEYQESEFCKNIEQFNNEAKSPLLKLDNIPGTDWKSLGPDNFSENISDILFDINDENKNTIYAASNFGGIYKSFDRGITWEKINLNCESFLNISSLFQTSDGTIYASTGYNEYETTSAGQGLYVSKDGNEFKLIESTKIDPSNPEDQWLNINDVVYDESTKTLWVATAKGIKYSTDNGTSWSSAKNTDGSEINTPVLKLATNNNGKVFASVRLYSNPSVLSTGREHMFVLNNDGVTFENLSLEENVSSPFGDNNKKLTFAFSKNNPEVGYAIASSKAGRLIDLYKTVNAGETWTVAFPGSEDVINPLDGQGDYSLFISVDPNNDDIIYFGASEIWKGEKTSDDGMYFLTKKSQSDINFMANYTRGKINKVIIDKNDSGNCFISTRAGIFKGNINKSEYIPSVRNLNSNNVLSVGIAREKDAGVFSTNNHGCVYISGKSNTPEYGKSLKYTNSAGTQYSYAYFTQQSALNTNTVYFSTNGSKHIARYNQADKLYNEFLDTEQIKIGSDKTPGILLFETTNNPVALDTLYYTNNFKTYTIPAPTEEGEEPRVVAAKHSFSDTEYIPITAKVTEDLKPGESIKIPDHVVSRMFFTGADALYMTLHAPYFSKYELDPDDENAVLGDENIHWWKVANIKDTENFKNPAASSMSISGDGNHVWLGLQDAVKDFVKLVRVSNIALANTKVTADISSPQCVVAPTIVPIPAGFEETPITGISVDPTNPKRVLISFKNGIESNENALFLTENALDKTPTFREVGKAFPEHMTINTVLIEKSNPNLVYVGTEKGLYTTLDISAAEPVWQFVEGDFKDIPVRELKQQTTFIDNIAFSEPTADEGVFDDKVYKGVSASGAIYMGTKGNGVYVNNSSLQPLTQITTGIDEYTPYANAETIGLNIFPNPVLSGDAQIEINLKNQAEVECQLVDAEGRIILITNFNDLKEGKNTKTINLSRIASGNYILNVNDGKSQVSTKVIISK